MTSIRYREGLIQLFEEMTILFMTRTEVMILMCVIYILWKKKRRDDIRDDISSNEDYFNEKM